MLVYTQEQPYLEAPILSSKDVARARYAICRFVAFLPIGLEVLCVIHHERIRVDYALVDIPFEGIKKRCRPQFTSINRLIKSLSYSKATLTIELPLPHYLHLHLRKSTIMASRAFSSTARQLKQLNWTLHGTTIDVNWLIQQIERSIDEVPGLNARVVSAQVM